MSVTVTTTCQMLHVVSIMLHVSENVYILVCGLYTSDGNIGPLRMRLEVNVFILFPCPSKRPLRHCWWRFFVNDIVGKPVHFGPNFAKI